MANIIQTVMNPNTLAYTLDLGGDFIDPYSKIVVTQTSDMMRDAVPIADAFFRLVVIDIKGEDQEILNRIDLVQRGEMTTLSLNLAGGLVKRYPDLGWNDEKRAYVDEGLKEYLAKNRKLVIDRTALGKMQETVPFVAQNDTVAGLVMVFDNHARPMAAKHGGSYEIVNMKSKKPLIGKHNQVTVTIKPDGACASCAAFNLTYGQLHKKANEELEELGVPYRFKQVQAAPRQQDLIMRRAPR